MAAFNIPIFPIPESPYRDLVKGILESYGKTRYGFPQEKASLERTQLENKFLPQEKQLQLDLLKLQPEALRTQMQLQKAQADKANAIMGLITQYLGGEGVSNQPTPILGGGQTSNASYIPQISGGGQGQRSVPSSQTEAIVDEINKEDQTQQPIGTQPQISYPSSNQALAKESFISHLLGFGANQVMDINGTKYALTGTGKLFPVAQGLSPGEEAFQKGMGKYRSEAFSESTKSVSGLQNQSLALDDMISAVSNDPEFYNVTGPVQSYFTKWAGNPAQQQLLGRLSTQSGEIALQVAPSLKGAFTGRDQTLLNEIKANPKSDMPDVFIGKLKAQKLINSVLEERESLAAQYIRQGNDPLTAHKKAARQTPLEKYRPIVDKLVDPIVTIRNQKGEEKQVRLSEAIKLKAKGAK